MFKKIAIAASLAILSSAAMAADQPYFYAGGDIGSTKIEGFDSETSYGAFGGYQFNKNFGAEVFYRRLADVDFDNGLGNGKADQFGVSAIGTIPLTNGFSVYGRLGFNRLSSKVRVNGPFGYTEKDHETEAVYGAGVSYAFSSVVSGRLEVQKPESDITNVSVGVSVRF